VYNVCVCMCVCDADCLAFQLASLEADSTVHLWVSKQGFFAHLVIQWVALLCFKKMCQSMLRRCIARNCCICSAEKVKHRNENRNEKKKLLLLHTYTHVRAFVVHSTVEYSK